MNYDDLYMLKLYIRMSDYENTLKHLKKVPKNKLDAEVYDYISTYCNDIRIFKLFENKTMNFQLFILQFLKNPFNNFEIIKYFVGDKDKSTSLSKNLNFITEDDESIMINTIKNTNSNKKLKLMELLTNKLDLNIKNNKGETNSQIILKGNPTDIDGVILEKLENLTKNKTEENSYLFNKNNDTSNVSMLSIDKPKESITNFINEPEESVKLNLADVEYNLLRLNFRLRRMYEFYPIYLQDVKIDNRLSQLHLNILNNFIFDKLLLEKI